MKYFILYNPNADNGKGLENAKKVEAYLKDDTLEYHDITKLETVISPKDARLLVCGGDGTLTHFARKWQNEGEDVYYFPAGTGNDFYRDVLEQEDDTLPLRITPYLQQLPRVCVNGKEYPFVNNVGYGIDGYACEEADKIRQKSDKEINYAAITIKGLLFFYHSTNATVVVDGKEARFRRVWLAPTMNGRYYGGGICPCPDQQRQNKEKTVSLCVFHHAFRLRALMLFPSMFSAKHVKHKKQIALFSGKEITVRFDSPRALQIDGETIPNVTEYSVKA